MAFLRSAISTSRAVNTFSSADTAWARAISASACASLCALLSRATAIERCCSASSSDMRRSSSALWIARSLPMRPSSIVCSDRIRAESMLCLAAICALSASCSRCARSTATSARWRERAISISRCCDRRACSLSRSISSDSFSASRFLLRMAISVSCSTSLRCFLRCSICSVNRVKPSASKALLGLKNSMPVWSSCVSDAASSSRPLLVRSSATASRTRFTYAPRFSCSSSIVISAAAVRSASTNLPSTNSLS